MSDTKIDLPETKTEIFRITERCKKIPNHFKISQVKNDILFPDLCDDISRCKCLIDINENAKHWDKAKRKSNPYELVHMLGTNHLRTERKACKEYNIDNYSPLSRAFFKMLEIYNRLDIIPSEFSNKSGYVAHLAEGPGGFMESVFKIRKLKGLSDDHFSITLYPKNRNIPGWSQLNRRKKHQLHNPKVRLLTGDLYNTKSILNFARNFRSNKAFLVTCDGGFDYSKDFNNQERNSWRIIFSEIVTGLLVQKKKGCLVCKMFDLFTHFSSQIIYILTALYEEVYIFKPSTSRPANSEKYIIAKGFKGVSTSSISSMLGVVERWDEITSINKNTKWLHIIIQNLKLPEEFIRCIKSINETLADQQKRYIMLTLECIKGRYNISWKNTQVRLAREWFDQYCVFTKEELREIYRSKIGTLRGV